MHNSSSISLNDKFAGSPFFVLHSHLQQIKNRTVCPDHDTGLYFGLNNLKGGSSIRAEMSKEKSFQPLRLQMREKNRTRKAVFLFQQWLFPGH